MSSLFSIKVDLFLPQIVQFDKSINLFCLVFPTLKFKVSSIFLQLTQNVSIVTYNQSIFITIYFIIFHFLILSDLNSNPNNLVKVLLIRVFLVDSLMYLNISLIA